MTESGEQGHGTHKVEYLMIITNTEKIADSALQKWLDLGKDHLQSEKGLFLTYALPPTMPSYRKLHTLTSKMRIILLDGHSAYTHYLDT